MYDPQEKKLINCTESKLKSFLQWNTLLIRWKEDEPRWWRTRMGRPFSPPQIHQRTIQRRTNFTKQLLIPRWGHQAPRKAAHCLQKEVGQNIKDKKRDKRARDGDPSWEGSLNRGSFQSPGNPRTSGSGGSFRILEGNLTGRKINKTHRLHA